MLVAVIRLRMAVWSLLLAFAQERLLQDVVQLQQTAQYRAEDARFKAQWQAAKVAREKELLK